MKITEKEFNVITGETKFTERDETPNEQTAREAVEAEFVQYQAEQAAAEAEPQDDLNASSEYRVHLAKVLVRRALEKASA